MSDGAINFTLEIFNVSSQFPYMRSVLDWMKEKLPEPPLPSLGKCDSYPEILPDDKDSNLSKLLETSCEGND